MSPETITILASAQHWGVISLLGVAGVFFLAFFFIPGFRAGLQLKKATRKLAALKASGPVLDLDKVRKDAMVSNTLRHCWDEFQDTLHPQKQPNATGTLQVNRWRATAMANGFFTEQALVDAPLRVEFYKHLPGILTGIGIIGTFSGLILGLNAFGQVDLGDAEKARFGLRALLGTVGGAFVVSGAAITLAMIVTTIEKMIINRRYTELDALCGVIDSMFDSGAGEEYLQRLVEAAETSATQAMQMKESLVTDLKQVLTNLTKHQIVAFTTTSKQLERAITTSLNDGLKEPLMRISDAMQTASNGQGDAVQTLMTDVLATFIDRMEGLFGGQMRGMGEMLTQTASTIQLASQRFEQLAGHVQQAGSSAANTMAERMNDAVVQMQARQNEANEQMRAFIEQLRQNIASGQSESAELTMLMMKELSESTGDLVKGLRDQAHQAQTDHTSRQAAATQQMSAFLAELKDSMSKGHGETAEATTRMITELGESTGALVSKLQGHTDAIQRASDERREAESAQMLSLVEDARQTAERSQATANEIVARMLKELGDASASMVRSLQEQAAHAHNEHSSGYAALAAQTAEMLGKQSEQMGRLVDVAQKSQAAMLESIDRIKATTESHLERMGAGAERLHGASERLSENLGVMRANSDGMNGSAERLNASAGVLTTALTATQQALDEHRSVRDSLSTMVAELRATVDNAKREAAVTGDLVTGLQQASQRLNEAQAVSVTSLEQASQAIGDAHGAFAKQVEVTLREGNRVFHEELAHATGKLRGAIQELGDVFDNMPTRA